jgi:ElaB/YqjD/DUF883 family membrane-anchored ribosome-binding protein
MANYDSSARGGRDFSDRAVDAGLRAADAVGTAVGRIQETGEQLKAHGSEAASNVQDVATNLSKAVNKSLKDQPMTTLGMAAVVGFVLGALWKS